MSAAEQHQHYQASKGRPFFRDLIPKKFHRPELSRLLREVPVVVPASAIKELETPELRRSLHLPQRCENVVRLRKRGNPDTGVSAEIRMCCQRAARWWRLEALEAGGKSSARKAPKYELHVLAAARVPARRSVHFCYFPLPGTRTFSARCCSPGPSFCSKYVWIWLLRFVPKVGSLIGIITCVSRATIAEDGENSCVSEETRLGRGRGKGARRVDHRGSLCVCVPLSVFARASSLLLASTALLRPLSSVPTSSATNSAKTWKPCAVRGDGEMKRNA